MDWDVWKALIRIVISLPIVVILIYLLIRYGLARNYNRKQGNLQIIGQVFLNPKTAVSIIKVADEYYLIGSSEKDITLLKQLENFQEPEMPAIQYGFSDYLNKLTRGRAKND